MSGDEEAYDSDNFSNTYNDNSVLTLAHATLLLAKLKASMDNEAPVVNPDIAFPKMTGAQWMELNLRDENRCIDNLRMTPDEFLKLHDILVGFGLRGTRQTGSEETLGIYLWTCAHSLAVRRSKDRFERSLDTVSKKITHVSEVMSRWADYIFVPSDITYGGVKKQLEPFKPFFDGCIGALDGTHVKLKVNKEARVGGQSGPYK